MIQTGARVIDGDPIQAYEPEVRALCQGFVLHTIKEMKHDPSVPWLDYRQTRQAEDRQQEAAHDEEEVMIRHSHTIGLCHRRCRSARSPTPPWLDRHQVDEDQRESRGGDDDPEELI